MSKDNMIDIEPFSLSNELLENKIYNFEDIEEIKENLFTGIISCSYEYSSEIQSYIIKSMFNKKDLFIESRAGTGKTTACLITSLQIIDETLDKPQVLILNHVKEMSLYSYNLIKKIGYYLEEDNFLLAIGKTDRKDNILRMGGY
jgi:superfamily II DNA/RNA helicase